MAASSTSARPLPAERGRNRGLLRFEGRHLLADPFAGRLPGPAPHHGQCHSPGLDPRPRRGAAASRGSRLPPLGPGRHPGRHRPRLPLPVRRGKRFSQRADPDHRRRCHHPNDLPGIATDPTIYNIESAPGISAPGASFFIFHPPIFRLQKQIKKFTRKVWIVHFITYFCSTVCKTGSNAEIQRGPFGNAKNSALNFIGR